MTSQRATRTALCAGTVAPAGRKLKLVIVLYAQKHLDFEAGIFLEGVCFTEAN